MSQHRKVATDTGFKALVYYKIQRDLSGRDSFSFVQTALAQA